MSMQTIERSDGMWRIVIFAGAAALIAASYFLWPQPEPPALAPTAAVAPAEPAAAPTLAPPAEPVIEHPIEAVKPPEAPPPVALDDSDGAIAAALGHLLGDDRLRKWFRGDAIVRRFVATVDNLSRPTVAMKVRSLRPVPGGFEVVRDGDAITVSAGNAARYAPYVQALERVDAKQLAGVYLRFYPLFQKAYEDLGYPTAYFNDRLVGGRSITCLPRLRRRRRRGCAAEGAVRVRRPVARAALGRAEGMMRLGPVNARE